MRLNRKHLSFLITVFSLSIMVLALYNVHLGKQKSQDEYVVEMVMLDDELEALLEEKEKLEEQAKADPIKSHLAFNETSKPSYSDPEPLKTLDEILEERELTSNSDAPSDNSESEYNARIKELAKKREEKKQLLGEREEKKEEFTNNLAERKTSVSYSLVNRNNYKLPPPIYTCIEGGKVVINIIVNSVGNVTDASFNTKSSTTSNGCLVDNAITYALKAKFNSSEKASQKGTITYLFQGK